SDSDVEPLPKIIESWSAESQMSFSNASRRVSSVVTLTIAPAVILISVMFFYALPRTSDAARSRATGQALVGFSESVTLSQVGQLLQSSAQALRIQLRERDSQQSYMVTGPLYVRGKVLERYTQGDRSESTTATWSSSSTRELSSPSPLPIESIPPRSSDRNFYDAVEVSIACESLQTSSLFSIAPYHELATSKKIRHDPVHWTLDRAKLGVGESHPRLKYTFGTNAFRGGVQTEWIAPWTSRDPWSTTHPEGGISPKDRFLRERQFRIEDEWEAYLRDCLRYDPLEIPRAKSLADTLRRSSADAEDNSYALAKTIEQYLSSGGEFSYTLNLNADLVPGVDPIEQFLTDQRRGHCQYFASALVMMLRSQDIPARMVVGYCTSEFNDLGGHYVARQLHAHAWVEALIPAEDLPENATVYGQQPWSQYWVRLDATPGGGGGGATDDNAQSRGVNQIFDLAQNFWKDFVVDMDQSRQEDVLLSPTGDTPMSDAYGNLISKLQNLIAQLRSGELGGGALANRNLFSVPGAMLGIALTLAVVVLLRIRLPAWIRRRRAAGERTEAQPASLLFYASAIELIARLGIHRTAAQTPNELSVKTEAVTATNKFPASEPFGALTRIFYDARYRGDPTDQRITEALLQDLHDRVEKSQPVASAPEDS
ncbi:MAG: transglutaminaseTgpA domain-containing protein, partial [Planctomycetota bacterium]